MEVNASRLSWYPMRDTNPSAASPIVFRGGASPCRTAPEESALLQDATQPAELASFITQRFCVGRSARDEEWMDGGELGKRKRGTNACSHLEVWRGGVGRESGWGWDCDCIGMAFGAASEWCWTVVGGGEVEVRWR